MQIVTENGILSFSSMGKDNFIIEHLELDGLPKQYGEVIYLDSIDEFIDALQKFKTLNGNNNE